MKRYTKAYHAYEEAVTHLREVGCSHPHEYRRAYTWEHDNGYGVQSMCKGTRCSLCDARDAWNSTWNRQGK